MTGERTPDTSRDSYAIMHESGGLVAIEKRVMGLLATAEVTCEETEIGLEIAHTSTSSCYTHLRDAGLVEWARNPDGTYKYRTTVAGRKQRERARAKGKPVPPLGKTHRAHVWRLTALGREAYDQGRTSADYLPPPVV